MFAVQPPVNVTGHSRLFRYACLSQPLLDHLLKLLEELLLNMPKTLLCALGASLIGEKCDSGRRRFALMDSRTLSALAGAEFTFIRRLVCPEKKKEATVIERNEAVSYHSAVTYFTALPPVLAISFCSLVAARPPPVPPCALAVPKTTCVTVRRPRAIECLAPWVARRCLSL